MKKLMSYTLAMIMSLMLLCVPSYEVYAADLSMSVSSSSVNIGDTVTVTVTAPSGTTATVDVYFPTDIFEFSGATGTANASGGTVSTTLGEPFSSSFTVTLKAKTSGTANISAKVVRAGDSVTGEEVTIGSASKSITVKNQTPEPQPSESTSPEPQKSADNSLSSLKLSSGTLSPSFQYNVTKYTATVEYDVTSIVVTAKAANPKAVIESITGNGNINLKVGKNTIEIVVKAENGVKATYTLVVTRKEKPISPEPSESESESQSTSQEPQTQTPETQVPEQNYEWNGETLTINKDIPAESIPADFIQSTAVIGGGETPCLSFTKGDFTLLYLNNANGAGALYVYDKKEENIYPFVKLNAERSYIMVLHPDVALAPDGFAASTLSIEGKGIVNGYQVADDFYLLYGMNHQGLLGWYLYDSVEQTFQRYLPEVQTGDVQTGIEDVEDTEDGKGAADNEKLAKELQTAKMLQLIIIIAAVVLILVLIIVIIVLLRKLGEYAEDDAYDEEYEDEDDEILGEAEIVDNVDAEDDEMEIEFYEMPVASACIEGTTDAEEATVVESADVEEDDEIEIEFYEMEEKLPTEEGLEEAQQGEQKQVETQQDETKKEEPQKEEKSTNVIMNEDDDDDLEFIDL